MRYCPECLAKQQKINLMVEEIASLKARLRYQERTAKEGPFGASTPSSKVPVKANSLAERQARCGGAQPGHAGQGRTLIGPDEADRVEEVGLDGGRCPDCGVPLASDGPRPRAVTDCRPLRVERIVYALARAHCPRCGRRFQAQAPGVLAKGLYGNRLLTHVAVAHYLYGTTLGALERQTGVGQGALVGAMKALARRLAAVPERLVGEYRRAPVKHADETGWRTDGRNGYAWLFATPTLSLFRFRQSRAAAVAHEVFGDQRLPGVLVVYRYHAYNKAPVALQYCYAHLKRDTDALAKEFPAEPEVAAFVHALAPTLAEAMTLRTLGLSRAEFRRRAARAQRRIIALTQRHARHPAIWKMQRIFRENPLRLYHWARDPTIPAENNLAERDLRPLVIARKVSFGSQSLAGARTRETLMSVLHTLKKRTADVAAAFHNALDRLAQDPALDPSPLLFPSPTPSRHPDRH